MVVVPFGFVEPSELQAFRGKRRAVGNGIGVEHPIGQFAIALFRIELVGDAAARLLRARAAEPFRHQLDDDVSECADQRYHQDDEGPRLQAPGFRGVINQCDIEQHYDKCNGHGGSIKRCD